MWLKLFFLLLYFIVLFMLARIFEAVVWYETGMFATQLVDPVTLSYKKLKTILECRGLGYSGLAEKKDVSELVEKSGKDKGVQDRSVITGKDMCVCGSCCHHGVISEHHCITFCHFSPAGQQPVDHFIRNIRKNILKFIRICSKSQCERERFTKELEQNIFRISA